MASQIQRPAKAAQELARRRGIYLLPNLFTTLNLFAGFYAIVQGMNHDFEKAARGAPHAHAIGVRRGIRQPERHGLVRRGPGPRDVRMGAA
jgi:hypothetical protein